MQRTEATTPGHPTTMATSSNDAPTAASSTRTSTATCPQHHEPLLSVRSEHSYFVAAADAFALAKTTSPTSPLDSYVHHLQRNMSLRYHTSIEHICIENDNAPMIPDSHSHSFSSGLGMCSSRSNSSRSTRRRHTWYCENNHDCDDDDDDMELDVSFREERWEAKEETSHINSKTPLHATTGSTKETASASTSIPKLLQEAVAARANNGDSPSPKCWCQAQPRTASSKYVVKSKKQKGLPPIPQRQESFDPGLESDT